MDNAALHLSRHRIRIHRRAAVNDAGHAVNLDRARRGLGHFHHFGHVSVKRNAQRDAPGVARRRSRAPVAQRGRRIQHREAARIIRQQRLAESERINACRAGKLINRRLHGKGVERIPHRPPVAHRHHGRVLHVFDQLVGESIRALRGTVRAIAVAGGREHRTALRRDGRRDHAMAVGRHVAIGIHASPHVNPGRRAVLVVGHVFLTRPGELHRQLDRHRHPHGLADVVLLDLAAQAAAHQHRMHCDTGLGQTGQGRRRVQHQRRSLRGRPDFAGHARVVYCAVQHFHAGVRQVGEGVGHVDRLRRNAQPPGHIARRLRHVRRGAAHQRLRLGGEDAAVNGAGRGGDVPAHVQVGGGILGRPGVRRHHRHGVVQRYHRQRT